MISIPTSDLSRQIRPGADSSSDEEESGGDNEHRLNIAQAFADDDVVEEFSKQRKRELSTSREGYYVHIGCISSCGIWGMVS